MQTEAWMRFSLDRASRINVTALWWYTKKVCWELPGLKPLTILCPQQRPSTAPNQPCTKSSKPVPLVHHKAWDPFRSKLFWGEGSIDSPDETATVDGIQGFTNALEPTEPWTNTVLHANPASRCQRARICVLQHPVACMGVNTIHTPYMHVARFGVAGLHSPPAAARQQAPALGVRYTQLVTAPPLPAGPAPAAVPPAAWRAQPGTAPP